MTTRWIVVAGQSKAVIYRANGRHGALSLVDTLDHPEGRLHAGDIDADRPGRTGDSHGEGRHALERAVDAHEQEAIRFAKRIAAAVDAGRKRGEFEELDIAATPHFLGLLRDHLPDPLARCVARTVNKNLVEESLQSVADHFAKV
ncbi:MAG: host attachment protein [Ectothiorhodospiraceae bacterium]|nr:host attachment protein [Chromatiales bacterium]MCP5156445.1 host attachment protein [Ectothiorhodospiraceae bacterium]